MAALSVMVITMVVNVCIQMGTGVIIAFKIEHTIIMVCILVLLLLMWSSAIAFKGQIDRWRLRTEMPKGIEIAKKDQLGLRKLLVKLHVFNYTGNPQTLLCETTHHHAFGVLCALSSAIALQAMLRSFALKNMKLCSSASGVSDYKWSIPCVVVAQFLTIVVGTFSIIYRWLSFVTHSDSEDFCAHRASSFSPRQELAYLKWKASFFRFFSRSRSKSLSNVFLVAKDFILNVLIHTQFMLYDFPNLFFCIPIYTIKRLLKCIIPFHRIFHEHTDQDIEEMLKEMSTSKSEVESFVLTSMSPNDRHFRKWMGKMGLKDMMRWRNTYKIKSDHPAHLIQLVSKCPASASTSASKPECALPFIRKLVAAGKEHLQSKRGGNLDQNEYRVSCISVLVLSRMLTELIPSSSHRETLMQSLKESFEIIYYVDQKTIHTSSMNDEIRWMSAKEVWAEWENTDHWFQTKIISPAFKNKSKESELDLNHALEIIRDVFYAMSRSSFDHKHMALISTEFLIICKFIVGKEYESVKDLFDFLEKCFIEVLHFILSALPLAIMNEIAGEDPIGIGEERVKTAFKFLCKLELLGDTIEWSSPKKFGRNFPLVAPDSDDYSELEANVSNVVHGKVGNSDLSLATTRTAEDDDDAIIDLGSIEIM